MSARTVPIELYPGDDTPLLKKLLPNSTDLVYSQRVEWMIDGDYGYNYSQIIREGFIPTTLPAENARAFRTALLNFSERVEEILQHGERRLDTDKPFPIAYCGGLGTDGLTESNSTIVWNRPPRLISWAENHTDHPEFAQHEILAEFSLRRTS